MKVSFILDSIDHGTIQLPEFQRGYVWSRDQVRGLLQSMYRRFPVGGLLIWTTKADAAELRGAEAPMPDGIKILLDGQQRVTSLYGVVRGTPPPFFEDPEKAKTFTGLQFHVADEVFEFYQPSKMADDPLWISVTELMVDGPEEIAESLSTVDGVDVSTAMRYVSRLQRLHGIRDIDLHAEEISGDEMTVDVVVDIFNRVNSGGTRLSKGDLALARICALRPEARGELRSLIRKWADAGFDFSLDWLLRCINVILTNEARFSALKEISSDDFSTGLKKAEQAVDYALNLLSTRLGIDHNRVLAGRYGVPVMVKVVAEAGGSLPSTQEQNQLLFWYIHQAAWGRYSSSAETSLNRDLDALETGGVEGLIEELRRSRGSLDVRPEDFDTQTIGSRFYPIMYMLSRVRDSKDFCSGIALSDHLLGKGSGLEVHHVFPKKVLYEAGSERSEVNAIANYAFQTGQCNRQLGARQPDDYFPEVAVNHPEALESQWIPMDQDLWGVHRYRDFLAARQELLANETNALLSELRAGSLTTGIKARSDEGLIEDEGEPELRDLSNWIASLGLARPETPAEIVDEETGEVLAYADAAWQDGMQTGRTEPVAFLLEPDEEQEARLGELGYTFFTKHEALVRYVEKLLNIDIDGDGIVGDVPDTPPTSSRGDGDESAPQPAGGDAVIVAARVGYPNYLRRHSYICQANRSFRPVSYIGFYADKEIKPEIAQVRAHFSDVEFAEARAAEWEQSDDPDRRRAGQVMRETIAAGEREAGESYDVYLLSGPDDEGTVRLDGPIRHDDANAWTQGQRYVSVESLLRQPTTTADLKADAEEADPRDDRDSEAGATPDLEARFHRAMVQIYERAKKEADYNATYFIQMVSEHGGLEAARRLIMSDQPSEGFTALWERGHLDLTVEAHALQPKFRELFTPAELRAAENRLQQYGYVNE